MLAAAKVKLFRFRNINFQPNKFRLFCCWWWAYCYDLFRQNIVLYSVSRFSLQNIALSVCSSDRRTENRKCLHTEEKQQQPRLFSRSRFFSAFCARSFVSELKWLFRSLLITEQWLVVCPVSSIIRPSRFFVAQKDHQLCTIRSQNGSKAPNLIRIMIFSD